MAFFAGQKLRAADLNTSVPIRIGSQILTGSQGSITVPVPASTTVGLNALQVMWQARSDTAAAAINFLLRFNGDTANHYLWQRAEANNATQTDSNSGGLVGFIQIGTIPAASATANFFGTGFSILSNPASAVAYKSVSGHATACITATNMYTGSYGGLWQSTAAVTSVTVLALTGNLVAGSGLSVYGL